MFKALLKKQLLEFTSTRFRKKNKKNIRGTKGIVIRYTLIFILLFVIFGVIAVGSSFAMLGRGNDWTLYSFFGIMCVFITVIINVFATYSGIYNSKDNELLLSLPLNPIHIILSRVLITYLLCLFYTIATFLPAVITGWVFRPFSFNSILFPIITLVAISFLTLTLTCIIGWIVAYLSSKFKNKSAITAAIGMLVIGAWIFFGRNTFNNLSHYLVSSADSDTMFKSMWNPAYLIGESAVGEGKPLLLLLAFIAILFIVSFLIISKSFLSIVTSQKATVKKNTRNEKLLKKKSVKKSLFTKERIFYTKNATYMLNTGMGVIIIIALTVFAIIKSSDINNFIHMLQSFVPNILGLIPIVFSIFSCIIISLANISVSSISLEGNRLWILKSIPVNIKKIFDAKRNLHFLINSIPTLICILILNIFFKTDSAMTSFSVIYAGLFIFLQADFGLILDLKRPMLNWTSEIVVIKQNTNILIEWLIGWLFLLASGVAIFFGSQIIDAKYVIVLLLGVMLGIAMFMEKWLKVSGAKLFANL